MRFLHLTHASATILVASSLAIEVDGQKHVHVESHHGVPQATQPMNTYTATVSAIPIFDWDNKDFQ